MNIRGIVLLALLSSCGEKPSFQENEKSDLNTSRDVGNSDDIGSETPPASTKDDVFGTLEEVQVSTADGLVNAKKCSENYAVSGRSNLYFAGVAPDTRIEYIKSTDYFLTEKPLQVLPFASDCLTEGATIFFEIAGQISHGQSAPTNADGRLDYINSHEKGAYLGKSDITAPLNAMVALFLSDEDPTRQVAPEATVYSTANQRNFTSTSPKLGQIFYIGDGKTADNKYQKVIIPRGAKRLFLGIMDTFEWNNNSGSLTGSFMIENK
jgi:hypothetical protein